LYDIVTVAIHNEFINTEGDLCDKLPPYVLQILIVLAFLALQLSETTHHVFDDTHCVLIECKGEEVLGGVVEVG
jgi:hypothetical protein